MIRVLHITPMYPSPSRPAFGAFVRSQVESLKKYAEVDLLVLPGLGGLFPYLKRYPEIRQRLKTPYDIIHIHYGNVSSYVKLIYRGNVPIITSYCGNDLLGTVQLDRSITLKSRFYREINVRMAYRDAVSICKSSGLGQMISERVKRLEIVPNGVDIDRFSFVSKEAARKELGLVESDRKIILFPANPERPGKNYPFLEQVLAPFRNKEQFYVLSFAGGSVDPSRIPFYFKAADLVMFPSLSEGSPNVIKEAMAAGINIFSSPCGDVPWLLQDVRGARVMPLDPALWVQGLTEFFRNGLPVSNGRDRLVELKLDLDSVAKRILKLYEEVLLMKPA